MTVRNLFVLASGETRFVEGGHGKWHVLRDTCGECGQAKRDRYFKLATIAAEEDHYDLADSTLVYIERPTLEDCK